MTEAPKRIWAQDADPAECNFIGGGWWDDALGSTQYPHTVKYVRADLAQPCASVKKLVWEGLVSGPYEIISERDMADLYCYAVRDEDGQPELLKGGYLTLISIDQLKNVANDHNERRISEALNIRTEDEVREEAFRELRLSVSPPKPEREWTDEEGVRYNTVSQAIRALIERE